MTTIKTYNRYTFGNRNYSQNIETLLLRQKREFRNKYFFIFNFDFHNKIRLNHVTFTRFFFFWFKTKFKYSRSFIL